MTELQTIQSKIYELRGVSSQFVMTSRAKRPKSALPLAFTEHGALMLSSVLRGDIAIETSIKVTRAFVAMREALNMMAIPAKISELEHSIKSLRHEVDEILADQNDINESTRAQLDAISTALSELQAKEPCKRERRPIGFIAHALSECKASDVCRTSTYSIFCYV